jgi:hypothetical protein
VLCCEGLVGVCRVCRVWELAEDADVEVEVEVEAVEAAKAGAGNHLPAILLRNQSSGQLMRETYNACRGTLCKSRPGPQR